MTGKNAEEVLGQLLENFGRYSRDGETLALQGKVVQYAYVRSTFDPGYLGNLDDRRTFPKSVLIDLINKALSSPSGQASLTVESLNEDFDHTESMDTGHVPGNVPPYSNQVTLELRLTDGIPVLRTDDMLPWRYLIIK